MADSGTKTYKAAKRYIYAWAAARPRATAG